MHPHTDIRRRSALLGLLSLPLLARAQAAEPWPSKPVTIIVPSAAGGAADFIGRSFSKFVSTSLPGSQVVVDNRPGAAGILGTLAAKSATPDGYTFLIATNSTHAANVSLYRNLRYDPVKDFVQVGMFGTNASVLVARKDAPYKNLGQFIDHVRANPGKLNYGYYSSSSQVPPELLRRKAGLDFVGVSYKAITHILTDLMGGQLDFVFIDTLSATPAIQNERLMPLAVTAAQPLPSLPDVPAVATVLPGYEVLGWFGLSAPVGTPQEVVREMGELVRRAADDPAFRRGLEQRGLSSRPLTGEAFARFVSDDVGRWRDWIKTAGIAPQ